MSPRDEKEIPNPLIKIQLLILDEKRYLNIYGLFIIRLPTISKFRTGN